MYTWTVLQTGNRGLLSFPARRSTVRCSKYKKQCTCPAKAPTVRRTQIMSAQHSFDTGHSDILHDAQLDYYGKRLATCSTDRKVRVFEVGKSNGENTLLAELSGHEGPVWQISWAHPRFGNILASCSYDRRVIIWKETEPGSWEEIHTVEHSSSVNSVAWAPHELGLILAAGSSDKTVSITRWKDDKWIEQRIEQADSIGVNAVSWASAFDPASLVEPQDGEESALVPRLVTGGCDGLVRFWTYGGEAKGWTRESEVEGHDDWIRDVAWCPSVGIPRQIVATASQDRTVMILSRPAGNDGEWEAQKLPEFPTVVWRVSWSPTGHILAVTTGDNRVTLWRESESEGSSEACSWKEVSCLPDSTPR